MSVLDMILVDELINTPTTVSTDFVTKSSDITYKEDAFAVQMNYDGGVNVNMTISLEVSLDGVNYAQIPESIQVITDPSGSIIYDLLDSGSHYMRLSVEVITGSIDVNLVTIHMRRRH
tara:strand:- start:132 stop:485 length:354 start_codon:yes stop_codon:yes gene_type:complete